MSWWNTNWKYRKKLTVQTTNAILAKYSVMVVIDTAALIAEGKLRSDGNDLRIVYKGLEIDRIVEDFNTTNTKIWFATQANMVAGETSEDYYLYYGNPYANVPPSDKNKVYYEWKDFEDNDYSSGGWSRKYERGDSFVGTGTAYAKNGLYGLRIYSEAGFYKQFDGKGFLVEFEWKPVIDKICYVGYTNRDPVDPSYGATANDRAIEKHVTSVFANYQGWDGSARTNSGIPVTIGEWKHSKIKITEDGQGTFSIDGAEDFCSFTQLTGIVSIMFWTTQAGGEFYLDNILIRRYTVPEPTVSVGIEEVYVYKPKRIKLTVHEIARRFETPIVAHKFAINDINRRFKI